MTTFLILICWILSVCLHEFGHAIVAYWGGDISVKDKGYLTLNPVKYIDLNMSLLLPVIFLLMGGIPLPGAAVYIQTQSLRNRYWQSAVSAAGPLASMIFVFILAIPFWLNLATAESSMWSAISFLILLNISSIFLNLLPIPPLDGYGIIEPWLPPKTQIELRKFSQYGIIALFIALSFFRPLNELLWNTTFALCQAIKVPLELVFKGQESFRSSSGLLLLVFVGIGFIIKRLSNPGQHFNDKANQLLGKKKYQEAIKFYDKAIHAKSNLGDAWYNRGLACIYLEMYEEAVLSYDKVVEINPRLAEGWYNRSLALNALSRYEEVISSYDKAIEINPIYLDAWYNRGLACIYLEMYEEAINSYDKVISIEPAYFYTWYYRGAALTALSRYEEAIDSFNKLLETQPDHVLAWSKRGTAFGYLKRYEEAIYSYNKAIEIDPSCFDAWYNKACCYAEQNNAVLAIETLEKAISIEPVTSVEYAKTDPSFSLIRDNEKFQKLII